MVNLFYQFLKFSDISKLQIIIFDAPFELQVMDLMGQ